MSETSRPEGCRFGRSSLLVCFRSRRRTLSAPPLAGLLIGAALLLGPASARADNSTSLTVIGTSDVSDSGLMSNVIQPAFQKAYPGYTFKYIGTATGTAISGA